MQLPDLREFAKRGRRAWRTRPRLSTDLAVAVIFAVALILLGWMLTRPQAPRVNITIGTGAPPTPRALPSNATSCPAPTGTVRTVNPGGTPATNTTDLEKATAGLHAGDTLVLNDGTYTLSRLWSISGIKGTVANPIIIEAAHDGGATINGTGMADPGDYGIIWVTNSDYVILCGFDARNSPGNGIRVGGDGNPSCTTAGCQPSFANSVTNVTLERITVSNIGTAHQSDGTGNFGCFVAEWNSVRVDSHILFQDDAAWGQGCRYGMMSYDAAGVIFRRDWDSNSWIPTASFTPAPRADFGCYNSQNCLFENDIAVNDVPSQTDVNFYFGEWNDQNCASGCGVFPDEHNTYLGDIFYNNCGGFFENNGTQGGNTFKDDVFDNPSNSNCSAYQGDHFYPSGLSLMASGSAGADTVSNSVFVNAPNKGQGGLDTSLQSNPGTPPTVTNSVFLNNARAITPGAGAVPIQAHNDFSGNTRIGVTPESTDKTGSPGYNTSTYGAGAYLMPAPNFTGQGSGGADMGAHITYEYVNGSLTSTPLWPWPMEDRIMADTGHSVTYASGGGIWKTLSGVYP